MKTQISKKLFAFILILIGMFSVVTVHAQTSTALDDYVINKMKANHIPGLAFSMIKDGKIALTKGYGYANIDKDIPFTPNTINAEIASISKTVTATALMQLWENGDFQLDDPVNNYIPFTVTNPLYPTIPITFRMLLSHTSSITGSDSLLIYNFNFNTTPTEPLAAYVYDMFSPGGALYNSGEYFLNQSPGSQFTYSNFAYVLIGYLVEHISGVPFDQYCNTNIFQPLCMNHTSWFFSGVDTNIVSRPYYYDNGSLKYNDYGLYEFPDYPDGQIKTTVADLSKFLLMSMNYGILDGARILDSTTVETMRVIQVVIHDDPADFKWAHCLGLFYAKVYGTNKEYYGYDGGDYGVATKMYYNITDGTGIIIFTNGESLDYDMLYYLDAYASSISTSSLPELNCSYISTPCEHSTNYWKNNSSIWAVNSIPMKIGTKHFYTKNQTLDALNLPVNGDASIVLAKTLIAAKLNMAQGSELSPIILSINTAMNLIGTKRLPYNVPISFTSSTGVQMLALAAILDSYNSGAMNMTACSGSSLRESQETGSEILSDEVVSIFPNPFSNSTTISFSLSQSQKVSFKIFDVNGRLVSMLADKIFEAGENKILWNADDVNEGIYFLRIQSESSSETIKLSLVR